MTSPDDATVLAVHPVIHVETIHQVMDDATTAAAFPVAGVFLIDHDADDARLMRAVIAVHDLLPDLPVGVNAIRRSAAQTLDLLADTFGTDIPVQSIWADLAGIETAQGDEFAETFAATKKRTGWNGTHFGGVAFKHQTPVASEQLREVAADAARYIDVPTTSGAATGQAAGIEKMRLMKEGVGPVPLALASGVTPENVHEFLPYVDHVLVATGISDAAGRIDPRRLEALLAARLTR